MEFDGEHDDFIGQYATSRREPDLSIGWLGDDQDDVSFKTQTVVEIGVSQTDESLREARDLYLWGTQNIQRVILVRVKETPKYSSATLRDIDLDRWEEGAFAYTTISHAGPVNCQNNQYVRALKVVWEGWERGPTTGQAVKVRPPDDARIVVEEPFGPIVPLLTWKSEDDVVRRANNTKMGLGASVWSKDLDQASRIARQLEAGSVWVNAHQEGDPNRGSIDTRTNLSSYFALLI